MSNRLTRRASKSVARRSARKVVPIGKQGANGKTEEHAVGVPVDIDATDQETIAPAYEKVMGLQAAHSRERAMFLAKEQMILSQLAEAQKSHQTVIGAVGKKYGVDFTNAAKSWSYSADAGTFTRKE